MKRISWGVFFLFMYFNFRVNLYGGSMNWSLVIDLLPDFVGFLLIFFGIREEREIRPFRRLRYGLAAGVAVSLPIWFAQWTPLNLPFPSLWITLDVLLCLYAALEVLLGYRALAVKYGANLKLKLLTAAYILLAAGRILPEVYLRLQSPAVSFNVDAFQPVAAISVGLLLIHLLGLLLYLIALHGVRKRYVDAKTRYEQEVSITAAILAASSAQSAEETNADLSSKN